MAKRSPKPRARPKAVVFDVDGPLYDGHLMVDFAQHLHATHRFDPGVFRKFMEALEVYKSGKMPYKEAAPLAVKLFAKGIRNVDSIFLFEEAQRFIKANRKKFFPRSVRYLRQLKRHGKKVALLSLSPNEMVSAMGKALGIPFDYYYGSRMESRGGRFTGRTRSDQIHKFKANALSMLSRKWKIEKNRMRMRGDSRSDRSAARAAGVPFGYFNPDREARREQATLGRRGDLPTIWTTPRRVRVRHSR